MTLLKLKYVDRFIDRHRQARYYFRRGHGPRIALPGLPGSSEFMDAYQAALKSMPRQNKSRPKERGATGTFDRLVQTYFSSSEYLSLSFSTQVAYRRVIERFIRDENIGHRLVRQMKREHVRRMIAKRAATPGAANDLLKKIRILVHFAIDCGLRSDDPTLRLKKFAGSEFHTWTDEEITQFERRWPIGSCERTAFALLLFTGQRRSDVVRMAWRDIVGGAISLTQLKTGAKLSVPIHPDLAEVLGAWSNTHEVILTTAFGKPFSANGFGNYMADKIALAHLPDRCVTHGLRKAAARRLAEAGCSANEIASITGHRTLIEVSRYTRAAEQTQLAKTAIGRLQGRPQLLLFPNLPEGVGKKVKNMSKINRKLEDWRARKDSNL